MKLEDIENAINQNQFWDNNFHKRQPHELPIQKSDIWGAHFEDLYIAIPINLINSCQRQLQTLKTTIKDNQNTLGFTIIRETLPTQTKSLRPRKTCGSESIKK